MTEHAQYAIRGGVDGRERLRVIARTLRPTTTALFDRLGIAEGSVCLDVGCGGGDVTQELAKRVGPRGRVVGTDIDETKLGLARDEAVAARLDHVAYRRFDVRAQAPDTEYDVVYARFLLSHLSDPGAAVAAFHRHLRPGGLVIVEDIDMRGVFTWPECKACERYLDLYGRTVRARGGNPDLGPQLPALLIEGGFDDVDLQVIQPAALCGEAKFIQPLTLENIVDAIVADSLATRDECDNLLHEFSAFAADPHTVISLPRIVQAWGRRSRA